MNKRIYALAAAAVMLCGCGNGSGSSGGETSAAPAEDSKPAANTLARQLSDGLDKGEYDITMVMKGTKYGSDLTCHIWGRDGDGCVANEHDGIYTEFLTVDGETYLLVPEVKCYELFDESGGFGNVFLKIGEGDELVSSDVSGGEVTEVYSDSVDKYTFVFDESTGYLKTFTAETEAGTTVTEIESFSWECKGVDMPDLSEWSDVGDNAMVSDIAQLKFSLYVTGGVTEADVNAAGYTYEEICQMDLDERNKVTDKLLGK